MRFVLLFIILAALLCRGEKHCPDFEAILGNGYLLSVNKNDATYICPQNHRFGNGDSRIQVSCDPDSGQLKLEDGEDFTCHNEPLEVGSWWTNGSSGPELYSESEGVLPSVQDPSWLLLDLGDDYYVEQVSVHIAEQHVVEKIEILKSWDNATEPENGVGCADPLVGTGDFDYKCDAGVNGRFVVIRLRQLTFSMVDDEVWKNISSSYKVYGWKPCKSCTIDAETCKCEFGVCSTSGGDICTCALGYTGKNCESNVDECASKPCQNGACTDEVHGYHCLCRLGYTGPHCKDTTNNTCSSNPCKNNAECQSNSTLGYICNCNENTTGQHCESCLPGFEEENGVCRSHNDKVLTAHERGLLGVKGLEFTIILLGVGGIVGVGLLINRTIRHRREKAEAQAQLNLMSLRTEEYDVDSLDGTEVETGDIPAHYESGFTLYSRIIEKSISKEDIENIETNH